GDVHVGQKIHLDPAQAVALAALAPAALDVEAEAARAVATLAGFRQHGEELADGRKYPGVGRRIRARRAPDRRLVNFNHRVDVLAPHDRTVRTGALHRAVELLRQRAVKHVVHEGGLARAGNARDDGEHTEWKIDIHVFQVIRDRTQYGDGLAVGLAPLLR